MKKILSMLLILATLFSMISCAKPDEDENEGISNSPPHYLYFESSDELKKHLRNPELLYGELYRGYPDLSAIIPFFKEYGVLTVNGDENHNYYIDDNKRLIPGDLGEIYFETITPDAEIWEECVSYFVSDYVVHRYESRDGTYETSVGAYYLAEEMGFAVGARATKTVFKEDDDGNKTKEVDYKYYYDVRDVNISGESLPALLRIEIYPAGEFVTQVYFIKGNHLVFLFILENKLDTSSPLDTLAALDELTIEIVPFEEFIAEDSAEGDGSAENDSSEEGGAAEDNGSEAGATE